MFSIQQTKSAFVKLSGMVALLLPMAVVVDGCKKVDDVFPAPIISVAPTTTSATPGQQVSFVATINAPGGLKSVDVTRNGAAVETKTYAGETAATYSYTYAIPATAPIGSEQTFVVNATDNKNNSGIAQTFVVTVSAIPSKPIVSVQGNITANTTWTAGNIYKLVGFVRVGADATATGTPSATAVLTIQPGTIIIGDRATKGTLIVQRGSQLIANGTAAAPIVLTSERDPGQREGGDWGGLVICGRSIYNLTGGSGELEGGYGGFFGGGASPVLADNSGSLQFVRVEFGGIPIQPNQEINGITLGAVGSGTVFQNVQVSFAGDDSFEWFGGSVNSKYLVAYRGIDDDFDTDNGFNGINQFGVGIRGSIIADQSGSNGFESDNENVTASRNSSPFTSAHFVNYSLFGPKSEVGTTVSTNFQNGMHLRRNTQLKVYNTFVVGYPNGIFIDNTNGGVTLANALANTLVLRGVVVSGVAGWGTNGFGAGFAVAPTGFPVRNVGTDTPPTAFSIGTQTPTDWFSTATFSNQLLASAATTNINLGNVITGRPVLTLPAGSALLTGAVVVPANAGLTQTTYIGAFDGTTDWTVGWSNFNPQAPTYR